MGTLLLRDVRPLGGAAVDVLVQDGRIAAIGAGLAAPADAVVEQGGGGLLLPGLVESHTHLDKTLWGLPWYRNEVGARLVDRIDNERRFRAATGHDAEAQSLALALAFLAQGTTRIRTHVDIDTDAGLRHLRGVLATRERLRDVLDLQVVAFPQSGLLSRPGTEALLREALEQGTDVLGGLDPQGIDHDAARSLDVLFGLATRHGVPLDIHLHETGEEGVRTLQAVLDRTQAQGLQGRVAISHAFCLGDAPEGVRGALLDRMARLQVAVITTGTASRPVPSLLACRAAGVPVAGGNDGIRDTWTPYGRPDMLERAMLIGLRNNLRRDDEIAAALECVTSGGAAVCGFEGYGLAPGCVADLVVVQAETPADAVVSRPVRDLVLARGQVVARGNGLSPLLQSHLSTPQARSSAG
ncbi:MULTISPECIES: amidohydrolase family protein [Ramlibacter]|uniref:Amidohydrolase family protein n=1 Tax=Ramlibacter pinisoli TaxID=2682844 RepID=A0A6N8IWB9_9BURK|nr:MULTISPECIES: amidohydrolase family protein [Ramlibacter]MBA2961325.1 amidohydrolase family protein [Ramlibacter sp. CGMCC 1.13660]MVQ31269.1 amidohydrolase family protein [Ramlibacter pinisoli]